MSLAPGCRNRPPDLITLLNTWTLGENLRSDITLIRAQA